MIQHLELVTILPVYSRAVFSGLNTDTCQGVEWKSRALHTKNAVWRPDPTRRGLPEAGAWQ